MTFAKSSAGPVSLPPQLYGVYGFSRRSVPGVALAAAAATPFAYRTLVGTWPFENGDTRTALSGSRGIHVREAIRLEKPVSEVYAFWRQLENLPHVMTHLEHVTELGDGALALGRARPG